MPPSPPGRPEQDQPALGGAAAQDTDPLHSLEAAVWDDRAVLRSVEISAELTGPLHGEGFHNLHWDKRLEFSLDCFICGRG